MSMCDPDGVQRQPLHSRAITITGCKRSDGLYEVEGLLVDTKPFDFQPPSGDRVVAAGSPIHQMRVRIVYDEGMTVRDVIAASEAFPYATCQGGPATLKVLIGLSLSRGWSAEVRQRLAGAAGCVHLTGLLVPMAATAFQAMVTVRLAEAEQRGGFQPTIDGCVAYSRHGDLVRERYPTFYVAPADA